MSAGQWDCFVNNHNLILFHFYNHRQELCVNAECTGRWDDLSPHERARPVGSSPFPLVRNPLEPAGERQHGQGHRAAQQHGVCRVGVSCGFMSFLKKCGLNKSFPSSILDLNTFVLQLCTSTHLISYHSFLRSLKEAFLHQLMNGCSHADFQLRNDLLVITTLIAENPSCQLIVSTGRVVG